MQSKDKTFIRRLIEKVNPSIEIVDMKREDIDFGFVE